MYSRYLLVLLLALAFVACGSSSEKLPGGDDDNLKTPDSSSSDDDDSADKDGGDEEIPSGDDDDIGGDDDDNDDNNDDDIPPCENECDILNERKCVGANTYKTCVEKGECLVWSVETACSGSEICRGKGVCGTDECPEEMRRCKGLDVEYCYLNPDGFTKWVFEQTCASKCEEGKCTGCSKHSDCGEPTPLCDTSTLSCVECLSNTDCPALKICDASQRCVCEFEKCLGICCASGESCFEDACCAPKCAGKECGEDGCGGDCGKCEMGKVCESGACVSCGVLDAPCCEGGSCSEGLMCHKGTCKTECIPDCADKCGGASDGCYDICEGGCGGGKVCQNQECVACGALEQPCCESDKCDSGLTCEEGVCKESQEWYDSASNLTWKIYNAPDSMVWQDAMNYCKGLGGSWRLPTISELRSLVRGCSAVQTGGSCWVTDKCTDVSSCRNDFCDGCQVNKGPDNGCYRPSEIEGVCGRYLSATKVSSNSNYAWNLNFLTGGIHDYVMSTAGRVRCVRSGK